MARINFNLDELQAFIAVADKLSFKAAADGLFISQPALSRRIDKLEAMLNARLLERTTRRVALTEVGRQFLVHAKSAVEELELALLGISEQAMQRSGLVTIACVPSVANHLLPRVLKAFTEQYPNIRIRVIDESAQEVLRNVVAGIADFGLNFLGAQEPDLDFKAIYTENYLLTLRKDHRLAGRATVRWAELVGEKLISVAASSGNRTLLDNAVARLEQRPVIYYEANHVAGALGMVEAGIGVAVLPSLAVSAVSHPALLGLPLLEPTVSRTLGMILRKGKQLAPAAATLYAMLEKSLPEGSD